NDTPWQYRKRVQNNLSAIDFTGDTSRLNPPMYTDITRLKKGGIGAQFWSVFIPPDIAGDNIFKAVREQIEVVHQLLKRYSSVFELATTASEIRRIHKAGKIASLIGVEGGHCIENSLENLHWLYQNGTRYLTLTYLQNTDWADSATDTPLHNGLTKFGRKVIQEMNRLGMLVDLSHTSHKTMEDVLEISIAPVIFSHSSAYAVTPHPRNVPDDVLKRVAINGGIVMVTFVPDFISGAVQEHKMAEEEERSRLIAQFPDSPETVAKHLAKWLQQHPAPKATLMDVVNHINHIREVAGIDHIGIGADYEGFQYPPAGLEDVSCYPKLLAELLGQGYSKDEVKKIAGLNFLRVMEEAEKIAGKKTTN
ncbi:MAG: dipeptidase, partial [Candidatus Sumerlaeia bacterium]|nr:dipeptidase [Candidatus Sumerlaeia bacterium]